MRYNTAIKRGFDGLMNSVKDCVCSHEDPVHCGERETEDCEPGYRTKCDCGEHDYHLTNTLGLKTMVDSLIEESDALQEQLKDAEAYRPLTCHACHKDYTSGICVVCEKQRVDFAAAERSAVRAAAIDEYRDALMERYYHATVEDVDMAPAWLVDEVAARMKEGE